MSGDPLPRRESGRVVALDPAGRVLLLYGKVQEAPRMWAWYTPGGRLEPGETHAEAALRELLEETGHDAGALGPCVWHRTALRRTSTGPVEAFAQFFLLRTETFDVDVVGAGTEDIEAWRWWAVDELREASREVRFIPSALPNLLDPLVRGDIPAAPLDVSDL